MSMSRRGFLGAMLGAMAAPAIVKAENLMKIVVPPQQIVLSPMFRNPRGMHSAILQIDEAAFYHIGECGIRGRDFDGDAISIADSYPKHILVQNMNFDPVEAHRYVTGVDRLAERVLRDARKTQITNLSGHTDMKSQERIHAALTRILGEMRVG